MRVLYFAWLRERVGLGTETVSPPPEVRTAGDLAAWLAARDDRYAEAFSDLSAIRVAIDQEQATFESVVREAGEVAFFPPVTGG